MKPKALLGSTYRALLRPARRDVAVRPLHALARLPDAFDVISLVMQAWDLGRMRRIARAYAVDSAHHRDVHD